jgi:hypothetical protein
MRISVLIVLCLYLSQQAFSQPEKVKPQFTAGLYLLSPYYFTSFQERFNYGAGLSLSMSVKRMRISTGLYYNSKRYYEEYNNSSYYKLQDFHIDYLNIPIEIYINTLNQNKSRLYVYTGLIFNKAFKYRCQSVNSFYEKKTDKNGLAGSSLGTSIRLGISYHYQINSAIALFSSIYTDFFIYHDELTFPELTPPLPHTFPIYSFEDIYSINFNIGVEVNLKKKAKQTE